jgi:hypothetical protein
MRSPNALLHALLGSGAPLAAHAGYLFRHAPVPAAAAGDRAAVELVAGLVARLAEQGQRHSAIKLQLHVRRAGPDARPLPLPPEFGADALLAAEAARVAIGGGAM